MSKQTMRLADPVLLAAYDRFFSTPALACFSFQDADFERATLIQAHHGFKTVDALHLAVAIENGCDRFLTNDHRLARFTDLTVEVLP